MLDSLTRHLPHGQASDFATELTKAAPPLAVAGASAAGMSLQDWVLIATLVYTVLQIAHLVWKLVKGWKSGGAADG